MINELKKEVAIPAGMAVKSDKVRIVRFQAMESSTGTFAKQAGLLILGLGSDSLIYTYFQPGKVWLIAE